MYSTQTSGSNGFGGHARSHRLPLRLHHTLKMGSSRLARLLVSHVGVSPAFTITILISRSRQHTHSSSAEPPPSPAGRRNVTRVLFLDSHYSMVPTLPGILLGGGKGEGRRGLFISVKWNLFWDPVLFSSSAPEECHIIPQFPTTYAVIRVI